MLVPWRIPFLHIYLFLNSAISGTLWEVTIGPRFPWYYCINGIYIYRTYSPNQMPVYHLSLRNRSIVSFITLPDTVQYVYVFIRTFLVKPWQNNQANSTSVWSIHKIVSSSKIQDWTRVQRSKLYPIGSMYGISTYIYHKNQLYKCR